MKEKNKKKFKLYAEDKEVQNILDKLKSNEKTYNKILDTLNILGNFKDKTKVEIYEIKSNRNEYYIKLWCSDSLDNIFVFYAISLNKKDLNIITHITDTNEILYDLSLSKKFKLNKENINFIKCKKIYNFKYGRLITDEQTYYSLYLGDNIGYQLIIDYKDNVILVNDILNYLNNLDTKPSFINFTNMMEELFKKNNIEFNNIKLIAYKDFKIIGSLDIVNQIENKSTYTKTLK